MNTQLETRQDTATPQAWVGCLSCYNEGTLNGTWVDGTEADSTTVCYDPTHEELWVFDHEGYLGALKGETSPSEAAILARTLQRWIEEHGASVVAHGIEYHGGDIYWPHLESRLDEITLHETEYDANAWIIGEQVEIWRLDTSDDVIDMLDTEKVLNYVLNWTTVQHVEGHGWATISD